MQDQALTGPLRQQQVDDALRILEAFSAANALRFDRIVATRELGEAERTIAGDDLIAWTRRLVKAGESLDLRVQSVECSLMDALSCVRQGIPVATAIQLADGTLQWYLFTETQAATGAIEPFGFWDVGRVGDAAPLPTASADRQESEQTRLWVMGQPALPCEAAASSEAR
jgi:putative ABC transport system ATP-binding protein